MSATLFPVSARPRRRFTTALLLGAAALSLSACDMLGELLELPNPTREQAERKAEGSAIGGACRHAGRSLEDCYALNPGADKAAVFAGWREMNDYMMQYQLSDVPSQFVPGLPGSHPGSPRPLIELPARPQ